MKHLILTLALLLSCSLLALAQRGISYQAVILDPKPIEIPGQDITGQPFENGDVSLKFKLFSATFVQEFEEVHVAKTDAYGLVNVLIGSVSPAAFASLVWDINPRSMQVWVSFDQGGTYTKVSEQVLTYSPYSLYAETTGTAGKLSGTLTIGEGGTGAKTAANARTNLGLGNVDNTSDANKPVSTATQAALDSKVNELTTYVNNQVAAATIPDADAANKGKIQLAGDLAGTAAAPTVPGLALKADALAVNAELNLKANAADVTNSLALKANAAETRTLLREKEIIENKSINVIADAASDTKYPTVKSIKNYVDTQVAAATIADADASTKGKIQLAGDLAGTAAAPTVPGLALKANAVDMAASLARKANAVDVTEALSAKVSTSDLTSGLALKADAADVTSALATKASTSDLTSGLALKANTSDMTAALALKAPLASPTFSGTVTTAAITTGALSSTAVSAPTYASAPRGLTYSGSTINWNPALGLNAAITLTQNSTLSFTAAPPVGSYGTVVLTQDGTGGRTLTLPTLPGATNQVLGSTSTSTVALSTAASSKDILNFYYDGTVVYWNIGQGYGAASTTNSGPTNLTSGVTGTLAVGNGGTGATSLSGLVKGNGTSAMTAAVAGTDYQEPLTLSTTGSGAATLVGTTLTIPTPATYALPTASASALGGVKVGTNLSIDGSGVLSADVSASTISGTLTVGKGGTGATSPTAAFNALAPTQTSNAGKFLTTDGSTTSWGTVASTLPTTVNTSANYNIVMATGSNAALVTGTGNGGTTATLNPNTGQMNVAGLTAQGYGITSPIYASTPQNLTDAATIAWNPLNGLNASVTLGGNRALSFTGTLIAGSYGTLVVTQDANGGRTLTLPSVANKVLGSASTTTIALSSAGNAKDIVNFYYDGTNYFWNIGQGYGAAATASTTNLASSVTGTLGVANGGTGAATLTGYVKGAGTASMTASATIPVADVTGAAPLESPIFQGDAKAVTASSGDNDVSIATTAFVKTAVAAASGGGVHYLGEQFGGGTVFYINSTGTHGLIVENADLGTTRPFTIDGVSSNGTNTMWMVGARYQSKNPSAHTTEGKEFFDWEIPQIYELHYLYQAINSSNTDLNTLKSTFGTKSYWSNSFEQSYTQSLVMRLSDGVVSNMGDRQMYNVRCIRRF